MRHWQFAKTRWLTAVIAAISGLIGATPAKAAAWDWGSEVRLTGRSNDNPTLRNDNSGAKITSAESLTGQVEFDLIRSTPSSRIEITPRISRNYYPDDAFKDLENTNWFLSADGRWQRERVSWNLALRTEDVSLLSNEDSNDLGTGGSLFRVDDTRSRTTIAPGLNWIISEKDSISIGASYTEVDYALDFTNRADQDSISGSINYLRAVTARQTLGLSATAGRSESERKLVEDDPITVENDFDSLNLSANYSFILSPDFSISFRYGRQESDTSSSGNRVVVEDPDEITFFLGDCAAVTDVGDVPGTPLNIFDTVDCKRNVKSNTYAADVTKIFELSRWRLSLAQTIAPNSSGAPTERNQVTLNYVKDLTEKLRFDTELSAYEQNSVNLENFSNQNRNFRGEIGLDWVIDRNWAVGAQYIYRYRENSRSASLDINGNPFDSSGNIDSNEFGFYIRYFIERPEL